MVLSYKTRSGVWGIGFRQAARVGVLIILSLFCIQYLSAQIQESPKLSPEEQLERLPHDSSRIKPLLLLIKSWSPRDSVKAMNYIKEGLVLAKKYNRLREVCSLFGLWEELLMDRGDFTEAAEKLDSEKVLATRISDFRNLTTVYLDGGNLDILLDKYAVAEREYFEGLRLAEKIGDTTLIRVALINIGIAYQNEKNYTKCVEYASRCLSLTRPNQITLITQCLENIALAYVAEKKYGQARDSILRAMHLYESEKNEIGVASMYTVLAWTYKDDYPKQLEYALHAQEMWERLAPKNSYSLQNMTILGGAYNALATRNADSSGIPGLPVTQAERKQWRAKSYAYYTRALQLAKEVSSQSDIADISDSLSVLNASDAHYKEALGYLREYIRLYDTIYSQENKNEMAGLEANYKVELKDKELEINQLELANQTKIRWLLISSLSLVLLVMALVYRQSRTRKKNNASLSVLNGQLGNANTQLEAMNSSLEESNGKLEEANRVKTKFFGILNHDLRSPVANLITLLQLREMEPELMDEQSMKARTGQITTVAEDLLETMEELLIWSKGQMEQFRPDIKKVAVADLFGDIRKKIELEGLFPLENLHIDLPSDLAVLTDEHFARTMLRNLTGNAVKALAGIADGQIWWKAWSDRTAVWLSITDNGPGATKEQLSPLFDGNASVGIRSGLGLHIVRDMAQAIGCEIQVYSPPVGGLEIRLKMEDASSHV